MQLDRDTIRKHRAWLARGRRGSGRLRLRDTRLVHQRHSGARLTLAWFERCVLDDAFFVGATLERVLWRACSAQRTHLARAWMSGARLSDCDFTGADLRLTRLDASQVEGCSFAGALLDRSDWRKAVVRNTSFRGAWVYDAAFDRAHVVGCDFREADFTCQETLLQGIGTSKHTCFEDCDFRGAIFAGRRLRWTHFVRCRFHGLRGHPALEGACTIEAPDFSPAGDGSDVRSAEALLALWGAA